MTSRRSIMIGVAGAACLAATGLTATGLAQDKATVDSVMSALRGINAAVSWDARSIVTADINCDGRPDNLTVGYQGGAIWVGLVPGGRASGARRPTALKFTIETGKPEAFCSTPVRLATEPLVCTNGAGPLPGCKPAPGCSAFIVTDDVCGPFHFHWDNDRNALSWSRR